MKGFYNNVSELPHVHASMHCSFVAYFSAYSCFFVQWRCLNLSAAQSHRSITEGKSIPSIDVVHYSLFVGYLSFDLAYPFIKEHLGIFYIHV